MQTNGKMTAYAKVSFTATNLIIDIRMDYGGNNEFGLPGRWITSYQIDKNNNLKEKIEPFTEDGVPLDTEYVVFKRTK